MNRILWTNCGDRSNRSIRFSVSVLVLLVLVVAGAAVAVESQETEAAVPTVDATFGTDLDRAAREVIGSAEVFAGDVGKIYCLTRVQGLEYPTTVTHAWYHDGQPKARVELRIGSSDWRTWSSKTILPAWTGNWEVKVLDDSGKVLATSGFAVN
jgi:DUF2914 family protein